jgi:hypothetical protein
MSFFDLVDELEDPLCEPSGNEEELDAPSPVAEDNNGNESKEQLCNTTTDSSSSSSSSSHLEARVSIKEERGRSLKSGRKYFENLVKKSHK